MSILDDLVNGRLNPAQMDHALSGLLTQLYYQERGQHLPIVAAGRAEYFSGIQPALVQYNNAILLVFDANDLAFRTLKLPRFLRGEGAFHVHWTKSTDAVEDGNAVKWVVDYSIFNGRDQDIDAVSGTLEAEDVYDDGTTTRIIHRTVDLPIPEVKAEDLAGYYMAVRIGVTTPDGTPLTADPALVSLDMKRRDELRRLS